MRLDIVGTIRRRIVQNEYPPGKVLRDKELMAEFHVSRTPIREALIRLDEDGLVRIVPNGGTFVTEVTMSELKDIFEVRLPLICLAARLAAERIDDEEVEALEALAHEQNASRGSLLDLDSQFHEIIRNATRNHVLARILRGLQEKALRAASLCDDIDSYLLGLPAEAKELARALKRRDAKRCETLLSSHYKDFVNHVQSALSLPSRL